MWFRFFKGLVFSLNLFVQVNVFLGPPFLFNCFVWSCLLSKTKNFWTVFNFSSCFLFDSYFYLVNKNSTKNWFSVNFAAKELRVVRWVISQKVKDIKYIGKNNENCLIRKKKHDSDRKFPIRLFFKNCPKLSYFSIFSLRDLECPWLTSNLILIFKVLSWNFILMLNLTTPITLETWPFFCIFDLEWPLMTSKLKFQKLLCQKLYYYRI